MSVKYFDEQENKKQDHESLIILRPLSERNKDN